MLQNFKTSETFNKILRKLDYFIRMQIFIALNFMEIGHRIFSKTNIFLYSIPRKSIVSKILCCLECIWLEKSSRLRARAASLARIPELLTIVMTNQTIALEVFYKSCPAKLPEVKRVGSGLKCFNVSNGAVGNIDAVWAPLFLTLQIIVFHLFWVVESYSDFIFYTSLFVLITLYEYLMFM